MQSPDGHTVSPESVSKAGAGALLLAVAVVELALDYWAAGWWQRSGALLVVALGAALLAREAIVVLRPGNPPVGRWPMRAPAATVASIDLGGSHGGFLDHRQLRRRRRPDGVPVRAPRVALERQPQAVSLGQRG